MISKKCSMRTEELKNVYESQQNLGQELGAGKDCLGSKWFVADRSNVVFLLWVIFIG